MNLQLGPTGPQGPAGTAGGISSVALAGTGLSVSGSPITTSGTITANVAYGTTAGTATQGNDARIATIQNGTINTLNYGEYSGGYISTGAFSEESPAADGGSIDTSAGGGSIVTSNGGGSINTTATGYIQLGNNGTRTTLNGSASTTNKTITLPNATGTVALTQQATDMEITDSTKGIILNSATKRWRLTMNDNGVLIRTAITLVLSAFLICGANAQLRDLVYNTNNVVIGPTNDVELTFSNRIVFQNPIGFGTGAGETRTNLGVTIASNLPRPYSGAATTNSLLTADGAGGSSFVANRITTIVKSSDQSKTNTSDMTVASNNDSELTQSVVAGTIYSIQVRLQYTAPAAGGLNASIVTGATNVFVGTAGVVGFASRDDLTARVFYIQTATGGTVAAITWGGAGSSTGGTNLVWAATGVFRAENSGTLTLRWAQNTTNATPTTLKSGSSITLTKLN
jgi:hypothetical protein